jgi:hypothetical protein
MSEQQQQQQAGRKRRYPVARVKGSWLDAEDAALRR